MLYLIIYNLIAMDNLSRIPWLLYNKNKLYDYKKEKKNNYL